MILRHLVALTVLASALAALIRPPAVLAGEPLHVLEVRLDRPTLRSLGVQVLIAGDAERNAAISVRWRPLAAQGWRQGPPLLRVWPETVSIPVPAQFAGSLFDLTPATTYLLELTARDPDGGSWRHRLTATTRPVPRAAPRHPRPVAVSDAAGLRAALATARPGHVITLAPGTYAGPFDMTASGTAEDPIFLRGLQAAQVVLDGGGCRGCDVLDLAGSHLVVEDLTIRSGTRGLRFSAPGATGDVARRLHIRDVVHGIGKAADQTDFYLCDNTIQGRLVWPWALASDAVAHWDDRGIDLAGDGHVVCYNRIAGFGDPVVNKKVGSRAWDVYGNDIGASFDGTELDEAAGNVRLYRNRFTDVMDPVSIQPIHGGPAYVLRNVGYNIPEEQIKLKSMGGVQLPSGALIYHNTFISPHRALNLQSPITQYHFALLNNLFVGPDPPLGGRTVDWTATVVGTTFDHNGYWPDGDFWFGRVDGVDRFWHGFAAVVAAGTVEGKGLLLGPAPFAVGHLGVADTRARHTPPSVALAPASRAVDAGRVLPGINTGFTGSGPDLGAVERDCPAPHYGPRLGGDAGRYWPVDCGGAEAPTGVLEPWAPRRIPPGPVPGPPAGPVRDSTPMHRTPSTRAPRSVSTWAVWPAWT